jgi:hypothetical protein
MRKLIAMLMEGKESFFVEHRGNAPNNIPDTTSPPVRPKSSVGSRAGEMLF